MPFKCKKCKEEVMLLCYLSEYGCRKYNTKDSGEYCQKCFDIKFKEKIDDKDNKK
jgi:hypothetical protein